jgi:hypothetical protein
VGARLQRLMTFARGNKAVEFSSFERTQSGYSAERQLQSSKRSPAYLRANANDWP